jgi:hypothetical protein
MYGRVDTHMLQSTVPSSFGDKAVDLLHRMQKQDRRMRVGAASHTHL